MEPPADPPPAAVPARPKRTEPLRAAPRARRGTDEATEPPALPAPAEPAKPAAEPAPLVATTVAPAPPTPVVGPPVVAPAPPRPPRPVWVVPTILASAAVLLLAVVTQVRDRRDEETPASTTTTVTVPTTVALDPTAPGGSRANPYSVGTSIELGGWRVTVQSVGGTGEALTADLVVRWDGRDDAGPGVLRELVLRIADVHGTDHVLGGTACPGDPAAALAALPDLDISRSTSAGLCWTVPAADRAGAALHIGVKGHADSAFLAVG